MRCLRSRLSVFVYNVCVIGTIPYMELFRAMDTHVQLRTASSDDIEEVVFNCNRRLCYIRGAFFIMSDCYINSESRDFLGPKNHVRLKNLKGFLNSA